MKTPFQFHLVVWQETKDEARGIVPEFPGVEARGPTIFDVQKALSEQAGAVINGPVSMAREVKILRVKSRPDTPDAS